MYGASGISTAACTLATATHVHLHDDQCTCINSGRLQGDIRLTKLAALRGAKKSADNILTFYRGERSLPMLQRMLSLRMEGLRLDAFLASAECSDTDRIRLASCRSKHACRWMFAHPRGTPLTDEQFSVAMRLRLGLPLFLSRCPLSALCAKWMLIPGMLLRALLCVGAR